MNEKIIRKKCLINIFYVVHANKKEATYRLRFSLLSLQRGLSHSNGHAKATSSRPPSRSQNQVVTTPSREVVMVVLAPGMVHPLRAPQHPYK